VVLDDLKVASLINRKIDELLKYDKKVLKNLEILRSDFHKIKSLTKSNLSYEASILEPFPRDGYTYTLGETFRDVSELKRWAIDYLSDKVVVAVDGSQIGFDQHITPKVAIIQTGYNIVIRNTALKNSIAYQGTFPRFYTPRDLTQFSDEDSGIISSTPIHYMRWKHEIKTTKCILAKLSGDNSECEECTNKRDCPLTFQPLDNDMEIITILDGTLILSFLMPMIRKKFREAYIENLEDLIRLCEKNNVIVAGFIVNSNAREISKSLWSMITNQEIDDRELPTDTFLFNEHLERFGERTPFFLSHRRILKEYKTHGERIGFFYVRIDSQMPTRIETPSFVYDWGKLEVLWRSITAECALGRGYPYTLARAHELAVIKGEDRNRFYRILNQVLITHGGHIRVSSKNRRKNVQII
jgi:hypothetical protein